MPSQYSPDLRIELIGTGDQAGVWGSTTNNNLAYVLEQAIAGYVSVSVISDKQALTYLNGASAVAADNQSVHASLALTTTTGANFAVYAPPSSKQFTIYNASSYVATIYNSSVIGNTTAAGTGVAIPANKTMTVWSDGTNFTQQNTHLNSPSFTTPALGTPTSGNLANCTFPTLNQSTTGNAATATAPQSGGSFITSANIGSQNVSYANTAGSAPANGGTSAACSGNAATASNPASGGSFITSSNIGSQNVSYANTAGSAPANGGTSAACSGNAATASNPASGGSFITSSNIGSQSVNYANSAGSAPANGGTSAACSGNSATATTASSANAVILYNGSDVNYVDYPVGTSVSAYMGASPSYSAISRNDTNAICLTGSDSFGRSGFGGGALTGTWRARGYWAVPAGANYEYHQIFTRTA
jgi:hypothetical protein